MELKICKNQQIIASVPLRPGTYSIGRDQDNEICLDDSGISRHHARLTISDALQITILDLNSTNGTWLDNNKVLSITWQPQHAVLRIGNCEISIHDSTLPAHPPARVTLPLQASDVFFEKKNATAIPIQPLLIAVENREKRKANPLKEAFFTIFIVLLIVPFLAFLGQRLFFDDPVIQDVATAEKDKIDLLRQNQRNTAIDAELSHIQELIASDKMQLAEDALRAILVLDPKNAKASSLQQKIQEIVAEKNRTAMEQEEKNKQIAKEQERQQALAQIKQLEAIAREKLEKKDFQACLQVAQEIITLDPHNGIGISSLESCSTNPSPTQEKVKEHVENDEAKTKLIAALRKLLKSGTTAANKKGYETALTLWSKAEKMDPDHTVAISKEISTKIEKLREQIAAETKEKIDLGNAAKAKNEFIDALRNYWEARLLSPTDEGVKKIYDMQLNANSLAAEDLYNEAIVYASLGNLEKANYSINQAKLLAKGNDKLVEMIHKKTNEFNKRP